MLNNALTSLLLDVQLCLVRLILQASKPLPVRFWNVLSMQLRFVCFVRFTATHETLLPPNSWKKTTSKIRGGTLQLLQIECHNCFCVVLSACWSSVLSTCPKVASTLRCATRVTEPFSKWGGHKCTSKKLYNIFAVWIGNCDVTSTEIWRHYLYTIWRSKYTILDKITPLWKRIGEPPGQISEIWSQITLPGPKIFVWPFCAFLALF